jgi:hypothetical protein
VVSQVPTPLQSTAPSSAAVLWSELMSPNQAKVPLQRCSAQDGPPVETTLQQYSEISTSICARLATARFLRSDSCTVTERKTPTQPTRPQTCQRNLL